MVECDNSCNCEDIRKIVKEIVNEIFNERLVKLTTEMKTKRKRAPSAYNIFIGNCMKQPGKNMSICSQEYKQQKGKQTESDVDILGM